MMKKHDSFKGKHIKSELSKDLDLLQILLIV